MKSKNKLISVLLASVMLLSLPLMLVSCSEPETVYSFGNGTLSENEYRYYLAKYKAEFSQMYSDFSDTDEFYSKTINGKSALEFLEETAEKNMMLTLISGVMFDEVGIKLSARAKNEVESYIDEMVSEYADGSKNAMNRILSEYGVNLKMLEEIYLRETKGSLLFDYLFGSDGKMAVTDENRNGYLEDNYVHFSHIYVNNRFKYKTDSKGTVVYDDNGFPVEVELNAQEKEAKNKLVSAIDTEIGAGSDFEEIRDALSEDKIYKNGYYITRSTDFFGAVGDEVFALDIGEVKRIESEYGVHYIKRLALGEKPWSDEDNSDFFSDFDARVKESVYIKMLESKIPEVTVNEEVRDKYSLKESPLNYRY